MLANIISHNREHDSTTTLKFGDNTLAENVQLDLVDIEDATLLSDVSVYDYISKIKTPFLMGYPSILTPKDGDVVTNTTVFELTPYLPNENFKGLVNMVEWQFSGTPDFANIAYKVRLKEADVPNGEFNKFNPMGVNVPSGTYYVRARYISYPHSSPFTQPIRVTIPSFKVEIPTLSINQNELSPTITASSYRMAPGVAGAEAQDPLALVKWTVTELDQAYDPASEKINGMLGTDFRPTYSISKLPNDDTKYMLGFPFKDATTNFDVKLKPNTSYLVTCSYTGARYKTTYGRLVFTTGNFKLKAPVFKLVTNPDNTVSVAIDPISSFEGSDTLKNFNIVVVDQSAIPQHVVHAVDTPMYTYKIPDGILQPSTRYSVTVTAIGNKFGASDSSVLGMTTPYIGIEPPSINITSKGMQPTIKLSPFRTIKATDTMRGTQWILYNHANTGRDNLIKEWIKEDTDTFLTIDRKYIEVNTNYKIKVRYLGTKLNSPWAEEVFKTVNVTVKKPIVTAEVHGLIISAKPSEYIVLGDEDQAESVIWNVIEVSREPSSDPAIAPVEHEVATLVQDKIQPWASKELKISRLDGVKRDTLYKITVKILGRNYTSLTSDPVYIQTPNVYVENPTLTISGYQDQVPRFPTITGTPFRTNTDTDKHIKTMWRVVTVNTGDEILNVETEKLEELTSYNILDPILMPNTDYLLECIYYGEAFGPSEKVSITFRTRPKFIEIPDDGLMTVLVGDDSNNDTTKYYGKFNYNQLNDTRNYLGIWNGVTEYNFDSQVLHNNVLYRALDTSSYAAQGNNVHLNKNRVPGVESSSGITYWEEDDRNDLCTYRWLLRNIGFQPTIVDNNKTGYTTGNIAKGNWIATESTLSKYMIGGKILYIYDTPELTNVSYNDLAVAGLIGRGRTIRIGERLYWARLLTEAESIELYRFKNVEDTNHIITTDLSSSTWLGDRIEGIQAKVSNLGSVDLEHGNNRNRTLRIVLEYISQYEEPWLFARKKYPTLQYDRYTDTGYFGVVPNTIDQFNIYTTLGLIKGTRINLDFGFLAFYSHGKRLLVNRGSIAYGICFRDLEELGLVYGSDVKLDDYENRKVTTLDSNTYDVRILRGGPNYLDLGPLEDLPNDKFVANANLFRFSEWNELIYRVAEHIPLIVDVNNYHGGYQIGRNWEKFDNINLGVFEHYSGNGCHDFVLTTVNNNEVISRGGTQLEAAYYVDKDIARNDHGARLVFEDSTVFEMPTA